MRTAHKKSLLAVLEPEEFVGRARELETILAQANSDETNALHVLSSPGIGASELIRQAYDRLFKQEAGPIPIYFEIRRSDENPLTTGRRFARSFLAQVIAFRRRDRSLVESPLEISELVALAMPIDGELVQYIAALSDDREVSVSSLFSLPHRVASSGTRVFVMIDGAEEAIYFQKGRQFLSEISEILSRSGMSHVFVSRRNGALKRGSIPRTLLLEPLPRTETREMIEKLSKELDVATNEQTIDLISVQLQGVPGRIRSFFELAAARKGDLTSFKSFCVLYAEWIISGAGGAHLDEALSDALNDPVLENKLIEFLNDVAIHPADGSSRDSWRNLLGLTSDRFERMLTILAAEEVIELANGGISVNGNDIVCSDARETRLKARVLSRPLSAIKAELIGDSLKRAPRLLAEIYRRTSSLGLQQILSRFDCQKVPSALFHFDKFCERYKGMPHKEMVTALLADEDTTILPQLVFVDSINAFDRNIEAIDDGRSALGTGFSESKYTDDEQVALLAVEVDSKLEAAPELVELWCSRLRSVAERCGFSRYQLWIVTPEGFSKEGQAVLREFGAYGSSRQQAILLSRFLDPAAQEVGSETPDEYEIVFPMGDDTELIAAQALEEVARRHHVPQKAINQIKTALVEACINAVEHSLSPDRKIYQKFAVNNEKIDITVSNRGLRLIDKVEADTSATVGRRGWGLSLMKKLMDEVRIERVDDGTRIRMTKFLKAHEN